MTKVNSSLLPFQKIGDKTFDFVMAAPSETTFDLNPLQTGKRGALSCEIMIKFKFKKKKGALYGTLKDKGE